MAAKTGPPVVTVHLAGRRRQHLDYPQAQVRPPAQAVYNIRVNGVEWFGRVEARNVNATVWHTREWEPDGPFLPAPVGGPPDTADPVAARPGESGPPVRWQPPTGEEWEAQAR